MEPRLDEATRLERLRELDILDSGSEEAFDRLTRLAAAAVGAPVAFTSLVDEARVWLKSKVGTELCETSRSGAFCLHTVDSRDILVVEDATLDPRFADAEVVTVHGVRFYAGAPIVLADGAAVGAVCVVDVVPRPAPGATALALLEGLAAAAGHLLDLRRELLSRREAERRATEHARLLELAEEVAGIGTFRLDVSTRALQVSPSIGRIFGLDADDATTTALEPLLAMYEPDDAAMIAGLIEEACAHGTPYAFDARLRRADDGSPRDVRVKARVERDRHGRPGTLIGVLSDVTAEKEAFQALDRQRVEADRRANRMARLADTDALTGLPNRRAFLARAELALRDPRGVGLAIIDLDHFKSINDRFGHEGGDAALATFGRMCSRLIGTSCFTARIGGEEFALLSEGADHARVAALVEDLRSWTVDSPPILPSGRPLRLTFSAGVARSREGDTWSRLFARADEALYRAKEAGRDRLAMAA